MYLSDFYTHGFYRKTEGRVKGNEQKTYIFNPINSIYIDYFATVIRREDFGGNFFCLLRMDGFRRDKFYDSVTYMLAFAAGRIMCILG